MRTASSRTSGYRSYSLDAGDEQRREVVLAAIWVFKSNLGNVAGCRQDEIGMFNAILPTVRHADDEWLKRTALTGREYVVSSQIKVAQTDGIDDKAMYLRHLDRGLHRSDGY